MTIMRRHELIEFYQFVVMSLEGTATAKQYATMMRKIEEDDQAAGFYAELLSIYANLACPSLAESVLDRLNYGPTDPKQTHESAVDTSIWNALLDMERTAPSVETEKPDATPSPATKTLAPASSGKKHRFWMYTSLAASTASIVLLLYAYVSTWLLPREVATLTSGIKAQWDGAGDTIDLGQRLSTKTPLRLNEGFAELVFDEGAKVVVEAPAAFELRGEDRMMVQSGRVTTLVSEAAQGFCVDTPTSRVTDLGTEFGVQVSLHGDTVVQMYQGRARLALKSGRKKNVLIQKGQARQVNAGGTTIMEIPFEPHAFVTASDFVSMRDRPLVSEHQLIPTNADIIDGLVAYWPLDGKADDAIADSHGTLQGNPLWVDGKIGGAVQLDGGDYILVSPKPRLNITGSITLSAWFKVNAWNTHRYDNIVSKQVRVGDDPRAYRLSRDHARNGVALTTTHTVGGEVKVEGATAVNDNEWHLAVGVYDMDATQWFIYVDGREDTGNVVGSASGNILDSTGTPVYIGRDPTRATSADAWDRDWIGLIDEVAIWNRALTFGEIIYLWNNGGGTPLKL